MRLVLTVLGTGAATILLLLAAAVASIGSSDGPYSMEVLTQPGLRPGVIVVLLLVCVPILALVGQCSRVGAPARDRRLAALRMAGGTPSDVRRIVALEAGVAAVGGAMLGGLAYVVLHVFFSGPQTVHSTVWMPSAGAHGGVVLTRVELGTAHVLPTDVVPHALLAGLALALVPVAATAGSLLALRHVTISPFGVVHSRARRPPTVVPVVLFAIGALGLAGWDLVSGWLHIDERDGNGLTGGLALLLFILAGVGLIFGSASCAYGLGRLIAPRTSNPALLIAARRMVAAPFTASRASTAVVMAVLLGAAVQSTRTIFVMTPGHSDDPFYANTFALLNMVLTIGIAIAVAALLVIAVEGIIARRRTLASLVAAGTPRRTLVAATLLEAVLPLVPAVGFATIAGLFAARGFFGATAEVSTGPLDDAGNPTAFHQVTAAIPWADLLTLASGTLVAAVLVTTAAVPLLWRSTNVSELRAAA